MFHSHLRMKSKHKSTSNTETQYKKTIYDYSQQIELCWCNCSVDFTSNLKDVRGCLYMAQHDNKER